MEEAFDKLKIRHPAEEGFKIPYSKFKNTAFRRFGIPWRTPKDVIAQYAREIKAESAASRYSREDFLEILREQPPGRHTVAKGHPGRLRRVAFA